jgi:hypothetical protein
MAATPNHGLILKITACIQGGKDAYDIAKILDTATGGALQIAGGVSLHVFFALCDVNCAHKRSGDAGAGLTQIVRVPAQKLSRPASRT